MINSAQLKGELYRRRKAFWIDTQKTRRTYHISLDYCSGLPGTLYEIEVEYVATYIKNKETKEEEIIQDISNITQILIDKIPKLKPSKLTKQEWLGIT